MSQNCGSLPWPNRSCDQSCTFPIGSYKLSQCCESSPEERSAGNLHATFCGNRGRATASGDPVLGVQFPGPTRRLQPFGGGPVSVSYRHFSSSRRNTRHGTRTTPRYAPISTPELHGPPLGIPAGVLGERENHAASDAKALNHPADRREPMHCQRQLAALFVLFALAGCAPGAVGTPNAPYQQGDPRDTSGMH